MFYLFITDVCDATIEGSCMWKETGGSDDTWTDARDACIRANGHLLEIDSEFKLNSLVAKLAGTGAAFGMYGI